MSHPNQTSDLSWLTGAVILSVEEGVIGTQLELRVPAIKLINGRITKRVCFEVWSDEEGNDRGHLALVEAGPSKGGNPA